MFYFMVGYAISYFFSLMSSVDGSIVYVLGPFVSCGMPNRPSPTYSFIFGTQKDEYLG